MSSPTLICEIAFGDPPLTANASATWVDVSSYLRDRIWIKRGRQNERDEFETGRATLTLLNTDRRFDPNNASGPYFGDVKPMAKIRIGATWSGTDYWRFTGYVESWDPQYPEGGLGYCHLECVDALKYFNLVRVVSASRPQEVSGDRIDAVLDAINWPAGDRSTSVGDIDVPLMPIDETALSHLQRVAQAERGQFFISGTGTTVYEDRSFRDGLSSTDTWGDAADGSELPYATASFRYDDSSIWNQVQVTRIDGIEQTSVDTASQTDYFVRILPPITNMLFVDDTEALEAADLTVHRYKEPRTRADKIVIDPGVRETWAEVLGREISDIVTIKRRTMADASVLTLDGHIESIEDTIEKENWRVAWQLSPVFSGTPALGTLNTTDNWIAPTLLNSWTNFGGGTAPAGYRKEGEWVYLRGVVDGSVSTDVIIFTLPVGYRPPHDAEFVVFSRTGGGAPSINTLEVTTSGDVTHLSGVSRVSLNEVFFRVI